MIQNLENGIEDRKMRKLTRNNLDHYWNKLWETNKYVSLTHNYIFATQAGGYSDIINDNIDRRKDQNIETKFTF